MYDDTVWKRKGLELEIKSYTFIQMCNCLSENRFTISNSIIMVKSFNSSTNDNFPKNKMKQRFTYLLSLIFQFYIFIQNTYVYQITT